jgi:CheY-like chemotaxis protein
MTSDLRHPHVVVVDDDTDTSELYRIMLASVGYRVELAGSVSEAAAAIRRCTPHVVMTDWRLPDGDGFAVSDVLLARNASRRVPIVAVTGFSLPDEMRQQAEDRGFTAVLLKPASPDDIMKAVRQAIEIGTARELRQAALRLRRYAAQASKGERDRTRGSIDAAGLLNRAAARTGGYITLMLADDAARYVAAGGSARELTGYEPQELLSLSVWDLTAAPDTCAGQGLWSAFIASGSQEGRYTLRRRDGVPVEAQYYAIANIVPGLHASAITQANPIPPTF